MKRTAHARRGSAPAPPLTHHGPPLSASWGGAKRGFRRKSGVEPKIKPSVLHPAAATPTPSVPSRPCLPRPVLDFHACLLQGPDTPPQFPTSPSQLQITSESETVKGTLFPDPVSSCPDLWRPSKVLAGLSSPIWPHPTCPPWTLRCPDHGPEAEGRAPRRTAGISAGAGHGIPGDGEPR